jgi:hypothetical protein
MTRAKNKRVGTVVCMIISYFQQRHITRHSWQLETLGLLPGVSSTLET